MDNVSTAEKTAQVLSEAEQIISGHAKLSENISKQATSLDQLIAVLKEKPEPTAPKVETAEMAEIKMLSGVTKFEFMGLPIGSALLGGAAAVAVAELVDLIAEKIMPQGGKTISIVSKGVAAWACAGPVSKYIGKTAGTAAALFLTYDIVRELIPFDEMIRARIPGQRSGEFGERALVHEQAERIVNRQSGFMRRAG